MIVILNRSMIIYYHCLWLNPYNKYFYWLVVNSFAMVLIFQYTNISSFIIDFNITLWTDIFFHSFYSYQQFCIYNLLWLILLWTLTQIHGLMLYLFNLTWHYCRCSLFMSSISNTALWIIAMFSFFNITHSLRLGSFHCIINIVFIIYHRWLFLDH